MRRSTGSCHAASTCSATCGRSRSRWPRWDLDRLVLLSFPTLGWLDTATGGAELLAAAVTYQAEVVIIDTVSRAVRGEENENDTWLNFYRHTGLALKQHQIACMRLDHAGKDVTKGQRGGSAKSGDVDAVWQMTKLGDDSIQLKADALRFSLAPGWQHLTLRRGGSPSYSSRRWLIARLWWRPSRATTSWRSIAAPPAVPTRRLAMSSERVYSALRKPGSPSYEELITRIQEAMRKIPPTTAEQMEAYRFLWDPNWIGEPDNDTGVDPDVWRQAQRRIVETLAGLLSATPEETG